MLDISNGYSTYGAKLEAIGSSNQTSEHYVQWSNWQRSDIHCSNFGFHTRHKCAARLIRNSYFTRSLTDPQRQLKYGSLASYIVVYGAVCDIPDRWDNLKGCSHFSPLGRRSIGAIERDWTGDRSASRSDQVKTTKKPDKKHIQELKNFFGCLCKNFERFELYHFQNIRLHVWAIVRR